MKRELNKKDKGPSPAVRKKFETVLDLMMYGTKKPKHKENQEVKPYYPMTMQQACREIDIHIQNFMYYINSYPELKDKYHDIRESRREKIKVVAEDNLDKAIAGKMALTDKDIVDISFKMLQATEKSYNPKIEIEATTKNLNLNISEEQILEKINQLMKK